MIQRISTSMGVFSNLRFRIENYLLRRRAIKAFNIQDIPVIINNFNRLACLKRQITWLEWAGMRQIYIIDNASTYLPLLAYYKTIPHKIFRLNQNVGFMALWKTILFQRFRHEYYIYTDPDIIPVDGCPKDAIGLFYKLLQKYPNTSKVGFGLKIDDLPNFYPLREKVKSWESKFWLEQIETNVYNAAIDTTFALYRPYSMGGSELSALRTGGLYTARHLSWYINPNELPDDEMYYLQTAGNSSSWVSELLGRVRNIYY